jgi:hypothetical protein
MGHTTLSRRSQRLDIALHLASTKKPVHLIADSTGLSIAGEGEWAAARHEGRGKRAWKKLLIGVDRSGLIVAEALTQGSADDAKTDLGLIAEIDGRRDLKEIGCRQWKKESGHHRQARVENTSSRSVLALPVLNASRRGTSARSVAAECLSAYMGT